MRSSGSPESFETALRLADGRALLLDWTWREMLFSSRFACPDAILVVRARTELFFVQQSEGSVEG